MLWLVPITPAELKFKRANRLDVLLDLFEDRGHPGDLREGRASSV